jgi:hypothetical protein
MFPPSPSIGLGNGWCSIDNVQPGYGCGRAEITLSGIVIRSEMVSDPAQPCETRKIPA